MPKTPSMQVTGAAYPNRVGVMSGGGITPSGITPDDLDGLVGWFDFSKPSTLFTDTALTTPVAASGDTIRGVTDLSGNGNPATRAGTTNMTYRTGGPGGKSVGRIDSTLGLVITDLDAVQPVYWIGAFKLNLTSGQVRFTDNSAATTRVWAGGGLVHAGTQIGGAVVQDTSWHIWEVCWAGASSFGARDGISYVSGDAGANAASDPGIGANDGATTIGADYGEVLLLAPGGLLSESERAQIRAYLKRWTM